MQNPSDFFQTIYPNGLNGLQLQVFQLPLRNTSRFTSLQAAADFVDRIASKTNANLYYNCGLTQNSNLTPKQRGEKQDIRAVPGCWIDIDVAGVHKKSHLPGSHQEAIDLIKKFPLAPSLIVNSGNGLHGYWLFKELLEFDSDADRMHFEDVNFKLQAFLRNEAAKSKWKLDSTHDCTRILRIVGTQNWKDEKNPKPVVLIEDSGIRYTDIADIEAVLPETTCTLTPSIQKSQIDSIAQGIVIAQSDSEDETTLDRNKIREMQQLNVKFKQSWDYKRGLKSPSEYVFSLLNLTAEAYWTDQEQADLIKIWYKRNKEKIVEADAKDKSGNTRYIAGSIAKARRNFKEKQNKDRDSYSQDELDFDGKQSLTSDITPQKKISREPAETETESEPDINVDEDQPSINPEKYMNIMSTEIGWDITKLIKYELEEGPNYTMIITDLEKKIRTVQFNQVEQLIDKNLFDRKFFESVNQYPLIIKKEKWREIINSMHMFMFIEKISNESSTKGRILTWIQSYLEDMPKLAVEAAVGNKDPFVKNSCWYMFSSHFKRWAFHSCGLTDTVGKMHRDFKMCGLMEETVNFVKPKSTVRNSCRAWKIPPSMINPESGPDEKATPVLKLVPACEDKSDSVQLKIG